jgi:CxxC-x17-CxxC domain-containing protein
MQTAIIRTSQRSQHNESRTYSYKADCTSCGGPAVVPFVPIPGKDLYCSDCFTSRKHNGLLSKRLLKEEEEIYPNVFPSINLMSTTRTSIAKMGISDPTPIQEATIPFLQAGHDVIGQARTGSGKTLAFTIPIIEQSDPSARVVQAIVLAPTRELAIQIASVVKPLANRRSLRVALVYGGHSMLPEKKLLHSGIQIVIGTPGRMLDHIRQGNLVPNNLKILVVDEADEMFDMGMAQDVEKIISATPANRQTVLFSATLPNWVAKTAKKHLNNPKTVAVDADMHASPDIEHVVYEINKSDKLQALKTLISEQSGPTLVFGRTKHGVKKLAEQLTDMGCQAEAIQGNLSQNARERVMNKFRSGTLPVLVATNVAARGLDIKGIDRVINFDIPDSPQLFTHRTGRTGRMGRQGQSVTFLMPDDINKWKVIERFIGQKFPRKRWTHTNFSAAISPRSKAPRVPSR